MPASSRCIRAGELHPRRRRIVERRQSEGAGIKPPGTEPIATLIPDQDLETPPIRPMNTKPSPLRGSPSSSPSTIDASVSMPRRMSVADRARKIRRDDEKLSIADAPVPRPPRQRPAPRPGNCLMRIPAACHRAGRPPPDDDGQAARDVAATPRPTRIQIQPASLSPSRRAMWSAGRWRMPQNEMAGTGPGRLW